MARVICTLPNASEEISGVKFERHEMGVISENVSDEQAANFASIKGYVLADDDGNPIAGDEGDASTAGADDMEALRARATELGIDVKGNWKAQRLRAEIKRAEDAVANKAQ
jgi:hypothetical protein